MFALHGPALPCPARSCPITTQPTVSERASPDQILILVLPLIQACCFAASCPVHPNSHCDLTLITSWLIVKTSSMSGLRSPAQVCCVLCSLPIHDIRGGGAEVAPCQRGYTAQMASCCRYSPHTYKGNSILVCNQNTMQLNGDLR